MHSVDRGIIGKEEFANDIRKGLKSHSKKIPSRYLYDRKGSMLFEEIMNLPEYYPTRCELEILRSRKQAIAEELKDEKELLIVDLGAGNGLKTFILLKYLGQQHLVSYFPIDISDSALHELERKVKEEFADLKSESIHNDYIRGLQSLNEKTAGRKLILFLGSSIGNFTLYEAMRFLSDLRQAVHADDYLLIGFDLKKNPEVIRQAYFDSKGITARFNLNILQRINEELQADFREEKFLYYPVYNPITGELKSFLVSTENQEVLIKGIDEKINFNKWECIQTECSNKYDLTIIHQLAERSGFKIRENYLDTQEYFCNSLWQAK